MFVKVNEAGRGRNRMKSDFLGRKGNKFCPFVSILSIVMVS